MKKHLIIAATAIALTLGLTGCGAIGTVGIVYTGTTVPYAISGNSLGKKVGIAKTTSVLGIAAFGEAGVNEAAKQAGIKKVSHVDMKTFSILGIFTTNTYYVYGD